MTAQSSPQKPERDSKSQGDEGSKRKRVSTSQSPSGESKKRSEERLGKRPNEAQQPAVEQAPSGAGQVANTSLEQLWYQPGVDTQTVRPTEDELENRRVDTEPDGLSEMVTGPECETCGHKLSYVEVMNGACPVCGHY
ncbi:hypothetical protein GGR50DRAFT_705960 [Xylaria sp. CBS 124048]|nr:hypothetical protein GGR50DRAFT_705960 [Xylaria sp. CBS 124048]